MYIKERAIDNIFIGRLWRIVKYENIYLQAYADGLSLREGLKIHFEFYNTERFYQSLDFGRPENNYHKK
jgi:putative transposase